MTHRFWTLMGLAALALGISACGLKGELKTPPPIYGDDERSADAAAEGAAPETQSLPDQITR